MFVYREEIEGLRAVAVIPVILYHAGFTEFFAGGYVGVDIFFVISGYLIASVIAAECDKETFSLVNFYERRCRRILPALFLILFISSPFAYYWMLPEQLTEYGQTMISINLLSSNFFFWWKDDGYFARLNEFNPLVHTWSLAIEEQFYFVFPILCYFFNKKKGHLMNILIGCAFLSFFLAQWGGNFRSTETTSLQMFAQHSWATFYLPVGRVWELLIGAISAFYLRGRNSTRNSYEKYEKWLALVGLVLIIISVLLFDNRHIYPFPNCYTLVPTCGASLIILYGDKNTLVGRLLSKPPLRWIGLISYSAYLWHQPLLAFIRIRFGETPEFSYIVLAIIAVFPLSIFSYFFIEQPFRQKNRFSQKLIFIGALIAALLSFVLALFLIRTGNNRLLLSAEANDTSLAAIRGPYNWEYTNGESRRLKNFTMFSNDRSTINRKLLLIGDSYSQDLYNMIMENKYFRNYEIRGYFSDVRCQFYLGPEDRRQLVHANEKGYCIHGRDDTNALPLIRQANVVIIAFMWRDWSAERMPATIKLLNVTNKQHLFVLGTKFFSPLVPEMYVNKSKEYRIKQYRPQNMWTAKVNAMLKATIDPPIFVDVMGLLCTGYNKTCPILTNEGKLISYDNMHLTKYGAIYVGKILFGQKPLNRFARK